MPNKIHLIARLDKRYKQAQTNRKKKNGLTAEQYAREKRAIFDAQKKHEEGVAERAFMRELIKQLEKEEKKKIKDEERKKKKEAKQEERQKKKEEKKRNKGLNKFKQNIIDRLSKREFLEIDLTKLPAITIFELLRLIITHTNKGKWLIEILKKDTEGYNRVRQHYTINDNTRNRLFDLIMNDLVTTEEMQESDKILSAQVRDADLIILIPLEPTNKNKVYLGAFFKYNNLTKFDLSRYGIYRTNDPENYDDTCLIIALRNGGIREEKIESIKHMVKNRIIPKCDIPKICDLVKIQIEYKTENTKNKCIFGKQYDEKYVIGLIDEHYFLVESTNITAYSIQNYEEVKDIENCNEIYTHYMTKKGKSYERSKTRGISSFQVVQELLKKPTLLRKITMEDELIASTQFYSMIDKQEITNLEYNEEKCIRPVKGSVEEEEEDKKVKEKIVFENVFFDFETDSTSRHKPYLCRTYDGKTHREFIGEKCGLYMLNSLKTNTRLIAHNCTYDFRFIIEYLNNIQELARGTRLISASGSFKGFKIQVKDSYHLISMGLAKFPKTFKLTSHKEVMPYSLYTQENIKKRFVAIEESLKVVDEKDREQFLQNIEKWNCKKDDTYDIIEYSSQYCLLDCKILHDGYNLFRKWILTAFQLDIDNILTIASLAHRFFVQEGCYDEVMELGGIPQMFIQGCVVGGRVMCAENKKQIIETIVNDFDAVSLYPSAMARMQGFLKGSPKVIQNLSYDWLQQQDGYFVDIKITSVGIHRKFPLMSYKKENGVRDFTNDMIGKIIRVDKTTLEDLITFQNVKFEILRGYYFNEGFNTKIKTVIKYIFNERLKKKKEENPAEIIYKLIMNSGYGKSIMKPVETESRFFDTYKSDEDFKTYLSRNYNWITSYTTFGKKIKVNTVKTLIEHYNIAQVGVCILSMSKRIMNEVICLADDKSIDIYYQDTDSMHLQNKDIENLAEKFKEKYARDLIGKNLGQFHSDFELEDCNNIVATKSIFLGKKCYIDQLEGIDKNGQKKIGFHIRMKGIPDKCIKYVVNNNEKYKTPMDLYSDLFQGNAVRFDLTNGGQKANFKFNKDYTIDTIQMGFFDRVIKF